MVQNVSEVNREGTRIAAASVHDSTRQNGLTTSFFSTGVKLLSEMGWRPGQGIGPRLTRHQKTRIEKSHVRLFGPCLPSSSSRQDRDDDSDAESDDENEFK